MRYSRKTSNAKLVQVPKERHLAEFKTEATPQSKCVFAIYNAERDSQRLHNRQNYLFKLKNTTTTRRQKTSVPVFNLQVGTFCSSALDQ